MLQLMIAHDALEISAKFNNERNEPLDDHLLSGKNAGRSNYVEVFLH